MLRFSLFFICFFLVPGCQNVQDKFGVGEASKPNPGPCPRGLALHDAARLVAFKGGQERFSHITFTGEIDHVESFCRYFADRPIKSNLVLDFGFGRGPAASDNTHTYSYFIAVTNKAGVILSRQSFTLEVSFPQGEDRVFIQKTHDHILIPRAHEKVSGSNFEIITGFNLTPEQISFNRAGKRFRANAGQDMPKKDIK